MDLKRFAKDYKEYSLDHGWTIILHKEYELYRSKENYTVLDQEDDLLMKLHLENSDLVHFQKAAWNLNYKINAVNKTITVLNEPEEFEE
ncbi:hypothetical protein [Metabacillus arenae]|uniref:Uncharacterized protein n=1 Tax=Metabacillus arenae TaxID=2771434 RepID=A0A926NJH4_9BACI|nr:hypothetical protein [Metabacillus arenae]MBD1381128.1 hypothetical protein [Metabacillus arenae]